LQKWPYDAVSELMRAKDELAEGRVEAAKALLDGLREKSPLLKQRIDELWAAHFMAAADRHLEAGENGRAIEAYTRFLSAAEGHAAFERQAPPAILRRGLAHYRQNSFAAARSDFRRSAALGQEKAGQWLWAAVNGTADKLYADGKTAAALVAMLGNFGRLGDEDRRYVKTVNLKTSLWRLSYSVSEIFAEIGKPVAAERRGPENQCDRLAAHANDPFKRTRGVPFKNIKAEAAISVCTDIINTSPDEPRFYLQRARAYAKARQYKKEARDLEIAMAKGYPMAFNNMGYAYLQGNGVNMSMERGADLYLETFNRIVRCCGAPVARHLISLRKAMEREAADFRSAGQMLLDWAARLGDPDAHLSLAALHAVGELPVREALGDWRATAYYHLRIAEKLLMLAESKRSAEKAGRDAQAMASTLPEAKIKSLDNAVASWRSETFATLPPWIWK